MVSCYTHRTINHIAATAMDILEKMNRNPDRIAQGSDLCQHLIGIGPARPLLPAPFPFHEPKTLPLEHAQSVRSDSHNRPILLVFSCQHSNFEWRVPSRVDLSCSVRLDFVDNLREKPCASLRLVDPQLNEACCRNVTMPSADLVCPVQELY